VAAVESMAIYGLYKVTMDLAVCYELKSEFADVHGMIRDYKKDNGEC
jgi:hypothetical protein